MPEGTRYGFLFHVFLRTWCSNNLSQVNPSYYSLGGHAESLDVDYDPSATNYGDLLKIFWKNHDPTK